MSDTGNGLTTFGVPFTSESAPRNGRTPGSRNRFSSKFVAAVERQFEEGGEEALRIVRLEDPATFLKICALIIPHELRVSDGQPVVCRWMDDDDEDDEIPVIQKYE